MQAEPTRTNQLVQATRAAGMAVRGGDRAQLVAAAGELIRASGITIKPVSNAALGTLPAQATNHAKPTGNAGDVAHRAIHLDRPLPNKNRGR